MTEIRETGGTGHFRCPQDYDTPSNVAEFGFEALSPEAKGSQVHSYSIGPEPHGKS